MEEIDQQRAEATPSGMTDKTQTSNAFSNFCSWVWANTDEITKWLQVIALIAAAGWTFYKFSGLEAGSLDKTVGMYAELKRDWRVDVPPGSCLVVVTLGVQNLGVRSFDVGKLRLRMWRRDMASREAGALEVLDLPQFEDTTAPLYDRFPNSALMKHFSPKSELHDSFAWIFYGRPAPGLYIARGDVFDKSGAFMTFARAWTDRLCR